jgi:hypothetical protein
LSNFIVLPNGDVAVVEDQYICFLDVLGQNVKSFHKYNDIFINSMVYKKEDNLLITGKTDGTINFFN